MAKCLDGCDCGRHVNRMTPEVIAKISTSKMGHEVSDETRRKIGDASRGRKQSPEQIEARVATLRVHGMYRTPEYRSWDGMKQRCQNPHAAGYENYGGRGITVCQWWMDFANFYADLGDKPEPKRQYSIDRPDNDKGYWCGHCDECTAMARVRNGEWATHSQQMKNRPNFNPDKRSALARARA